MGNAKSSTPEETSHGDVWWTNGVRERDKTCVTKETLNVEENVNEEREQRRKELAEDFEKFKQELARKHEKRRQVIAEKRKEMADLRDELLREKLENEKLKEELRKAQEYKSLEVQKTVYEEDGLKISELKDENEELRNEIEKLRLRLKENEITIAKNKELRISIAEMQNELQSVNAQVIGFEKERIDYQEHVTALKDIIKVSKEMLVIRENQIEELRKKITSIEELLASKEMNILSNDLRQEYERQLRNIRNLRTLYEERQRADQRQRDNLQEKIQEFQKTVEEEQNKNLELKERIEELERENSQKYDKINNLESNLGLSKAECKEFQAEMAVINQLFSQILLGFNNEQDIDLDKLIKILEENHDLLTNIVINEESNEVSALPKVLLDLVNQVNGSQDESIIEGKMNWTGHEKLATIKEEDSQLSHQLNSPEEIVENLPKVWRVLIELLSHQCAPNNDLTEKKTGEIDHPCYKSVQTPTGPRSVLSVSKTFIRLKNLILEKKSLEKEMTRLKHLNTHLEGRLQDQEKRLVLVSSELSKTWHVVGKMQKQHQQLHTQEKILRYELAQKRKMLTELKEELEYCRQKWLQARDKNSSTEEQWKQLRTEFASRKTTVADDFNNSVESGYSDDKSSSEDEEQTFSSSKYSVNEQENASLGTNEVTHSSETEKTDLVQTDSEERHVQDILDEEVNENLNESKIEEVTELQDNPSTSTSNYGKNPTQSAEEFVARREERMKRLEEQCSQLYDKVTNTSKRSVQISSKLDDLHEMYGESAQNASTENSTEETSSNVDITNQDLENEE